MNGSHLSSLLFPIALGLVVASVSACSSDDTGTGSTTNLDGGTSQPAPSANAIEAALAGCTVTSTLIQTTEWVSCLTGKTLTGTEPFNGQACELRIGTGASFQYVRGGAVALTVPERSIWAGKASGTYQNEGQGDRRIFLAGVVLSLPVVEGEPRVTTMNISYAGLASQDDTVEIAYLDAALARQTYNCTFTGVK